MRIRLLALSHIKDGSDRTQTAKYLKVSRKVVNDWARKFFNDGIEGLKEKTSSGRRSKLTTTQLSELKEHIQLHSIKDGGSRLNTQTLVSLINEKLVQFIMFLPCLNMFLPRNSGNLISK